MIRTTSLLIAALGWLTALPAAAQATRETELQELRQRVQQLEKQLQARDKPAERRERVTEIGTRARVPEVQLMVRVYDVGDLFVMAASYRARRESDLGGSSDWLFPEAATSEKITGVPGGFGGGGLGGGGSGGARGHRSVPVSPIVRVTATSSDVAMGMSGTGEGLGIRLSLDELIDAIRATISPNSWDSVGGSNSIAVLGSSLIINADEEVHRQIADLLRVLRSRWGTLRTVSVRAYWLWLSDAEIEALLAPDEDRAAAKGHYMGVVNRRAWQRLLKSLQQPDAKRSPGYRAAVTCFNGQTVHAVSGTQSVAVTGLKPVLAQQAVAYEPQTTVIVEGPALEVTPTATASGKYVILDLHSLITKVDERGVSAPVEKPAAVAKSVVTVAGSIDRPLLKQHRLATTVRIPAGQPVLVGGMTHGSEPDADKPPLYLIVETSLQELPDEPRELQQQTGQQKEECPPADSR